MIERHAEKHAELDLKEAPRFRNVLKQALDLARKKDIGIDMIQTGMGTVALRGTYQTVSGEGAGDCLDYKDWRGKYEDDWPKHQTTRDFFDLLAVYADAYPHEVPEVGHIT